jgi:serine phosphatase RsbU (regulator of sigma subunit)
MKNKIKNVILSTRTTLVLFSIILIVLIDVYISQFGSLTGAVNGFIFLFYLLVYFPLNHYLIYKKRLPKVEQKIFQFGIATSSLIFLGFIIKPLNREIGFFLSLTGIALFSFGYLTAWLIQRLKEKDPYKKTVYFSLYLSVFCFVIGILANNFNWSMPIQILQFNLILATVFIGLYFFVTIGLKKEIILSPNNNYIFLFATIFSITLIINTSMVKNVLNANDSSFANVKKNIDLYQTKNTILYKSFETSNYKDSTFEINRIKAQKLKLLANKNFKHISQLKTHLISITSKITIAVADTISFRNINSKDNYDIPTSILIGSEPSKPNEGKYSAFELKIKLQEFVETSINMVPEKSRLNILQNNPINLNDTIINGFKIKWEIVNFYHGSLINTLTILTNYQANIRYLEMIVLNELHTIANAKNQANLANQLVELSLKYETDKKQKQIKLLEKEKELDLAKMRTKDIELLSRQKQIVYISFFSIIFLVLFVLTIRSNILRRKANRILFEQKSVLADQKQEITDSIQYAQRIQFAILPTKENIAKAFPQSFVLFKPKDIVSGDFYWFQEIEGKKYIAACDCTGHGVPGALMSMVATDMLNEALVHTKKVDEILAHTNRSIRVALKQSNDDDSTRDGMDLALCCFNDQTNVLEYAGAYRPLWLIRHADSDNYRNDLASSTIAHNADFKSSQNVGAVGKFAAQGRNDAWELIEYKATKAAIGGLTEDNQTFQLNEIQLQKGDTIYLSSDGFADQFSPADKKLMTKKFKEILLSIQQLSMPEQEKYLAQFIDEWRGNMEQTDDVLVIGVRV